MGTDAGIVGNSPFLLRVCGLTKSYTRSRVWRKHIDIHAVRGVNFEILAGKTLALVGRSGSCKSTVARCVARLERPDAGEIWVGGTDIVRLRHRELLPLRAEIQLIFQDSVTSMNPRFSAAQIVEEPMLVQQQGSKTERRSRVKGLMSEVGLSPDSAERSVMEFSGGQRQRLAIA